MTQDFVTRTLPYNILWSWSPNYGFEPDVLNTYPGHDRVDVYDLYFLSDRVAPGRSRPYH